MAKKNSKGTLGMATVEDEHHNLQCFIVANLLQIFPIFQRKYLIGQETPSEFKKKKNYSIYDVGIRKITKINKNRLESEPIVAIEICNNENEETLLERIPSMFSYAKTLKEIFVYNYDTDKLSLYTLNETYTGQKAHISKILDFNIRIIIDMYYSIYKN